MAYHLISMQHDAITILIAPSSALSTFWESSASHRQVLPSSLFLRRSALVPGTADQFCRQEHVDRGEGKIDCIALLNGALRTDLWNACVRVAVSLWMDAVSAMRQCVVPECVGNRERVSVAAFLLCEGG